MEPTPSGIRDWFVAYVDESLVSELEATWAEHAGRPEPVVTLLGAYDTGKSALLRRLLVDAGEAVPAWVTISARHETFEAGEVMIDRVTVRDTPGITPNSNNPRDLANTARALAAVRATDGLWVVTTPQLATGETIDSLREIVGRHWPEGALRLVVSRFDEAGASPQYDLPGYLQQAAAKADDARFQLGAGTEVPVHAIAPDPYGQQGDTRSPSPEVWDEFRSWDGMRELADALQSLAEASLPALRGAAEQRFWAVELRAALAVLTDQCAQLRTAEETARNAATRLEQVRVQLADLRASAEAGFDEVIARTVDRLNRVGVGGAEHLDAWCVEEVNLWFSRQVRELDRIGQDLRADQSRRRSRPSWEELVDALTGVSHEEPEIAGPHSTGLWERFFVRAPKLVQEGRRAASKAGEELRKRTSDYSAKAAESGSKAAENAGGIGKLQQSLAVVDAVLPVLQEGWALLREHKAEREAVAQEAAARQEIERLLNARRDDLRSIAMTDYDRVEDEVNQLLAAEIAPAAEQATQLLAELEIRESALREGRELLGT